jgi:hypothetical protein
MSGKNNVNPDHYKVAGRDRQDDIARARRETPPPGKARKKGYARPAGETPAAADDERGEQADRR